MSRTEPETRVPDADAADQPPMPVEVDEATRRRLGAALEAVLMMATEPVPVTALAAAIELPVEITGELLIELRSFYDDTERGFELRHVAGGWRYYTRVEHAEVVTQHLIGGQQAKLSQAALETLAVIAYRQPVSRARVSAIRGVNVDGVVKTLTARELIAEAGVDDASGAMLFVTTDHFLERMGLDSLDDLPPIAPHLPEVADMEAQLGGLVPPSDTEPVGTEPVETEPVETEPVETEPVETEPVENGTDHG